MGKQLLAMALMDCPSELDWAMAFLAWQSYRLLVFPMFWRIQNPEAWTKPRWPVDFGTGWIIPIVGDFLQGISTPVQCFMLVYYPSLQTLGIVLCFQGFGIWDYVAGLLMDKWEPAEFKQLIPHMSTIWLSMMLCS